MPIAQDLTDGQPGSNPGLALTRLAPPLQQRDWQAILCRLADAANRRAPSGYEDYFRRLRARTAAGPASRRVLCATATAPTICGMGERTPGENGLTLHPVYGVPYLPGTSLKGTLRAWVMSQDWGAEWGPGGPHFDNLFGAGGHGGAAALVDILDGLPIPGGPLFAVDVLTPHFNAYYRDGRAPLGWDGPIPVQFLAAAQGVRYRIVVEGAAGWVEKVAEWLSLALAQRGVGAKTRAGYGRLACEPIDADHRDERDAAARALAARQSRADRAEAALRQLGKEVVRGEAEKWLRGEPASPSSAHLLPPLDPSTSDRRLLALITVCTDWKFREDWVARANNSKADDKKRTRARGLIEAWDARVQPGTAGDAAPAASALPAAVTSATGPTRFGSAPWAEPRTGTKPNKVAEDYAGRAGRTNAPSREAVEACLDWLRANEGKRGQLNQVRRAFGLEDEPA